MKDDYKLGKILATSAISADAPLGPVKPKRTRLKLAIALMILGYIAFAVYSNNADAQDRGNTSTPDRLIAGVLDTPSDI
ncbi:MAG: hypothetical protein EBT94_02375 [Alphaproteobacteria bacterium]|jgi:hypothetical protein|nr:hypothetical protein [Alphaproteobacteria bacterium]